MFPIMWNSYFKIRTWKVIVFYSVCKWWVYKQYCTFLRTLFDPLLHKEEHFINKSLGKRQGIGNSSEKNSSIGLRKWRNQSMPLWGWGEFCPVSPQTEVPAIFNLSLPMDRCNHPDSDRCASHPLSFSDRQGCQNWCCLCSWGASSSKPGKPQRRPN